MAVEYRSLESIAEEVHKIWHDYKEDEPKNMTALQSEEYYKAHDKKFNREHKGQGISAYKGKLYFRSSYYFKDFLTIKSISKNDIYLFKKRYNVRFEHRYWLLNDGTDVKTNADVEVIPSQKLLSINYDDRVLVYGNVSISIPCLYSINMRIENIDFI